MPGDWSSIPLKAAPFLSTLAYCPNTLKLDVSLNSIKKSALKLRLWASSRSCPVNRFSVNPSRVIAEKDILVLAESEIGIFDEDLNCFIP